MAKRIFFVTYHKVLLATELKAYVDLGFEVVFPFFYNDVPDQSAKKNNIDEWLKINTRHSTLSDENLLKISKFNFFSNKKLSRKMSRLLNTYFDYVIVCQNPSWNLPFLLDFKKNIFYRMYGDINTFTAFAKNNPEYKNLIISKQNFKFLPFSNLIIEHEENWVKQRCDVVPYWIEDDVYKLRNKWSPNYDLNEIGMLCPNISNIFYKKQFLYLKKYFEERYYKYFGVQIDKIVDFNIVGSLTREELLKKFTNLTGFLYHYRIENSLYLPPVEAMIIGVPVIFFPNSLLHRMLGNKNLPSLAINEEDAKIKINLLRNKDQKFISEVKRSQEEIIKIYDKKNNLKIFNDYFKNYLDNNALDTNDYLMNNIPSNEHDKKSVLIFTHFQNTYFFDKDYFTVHGIPRVIKKIVESLNESKIPVTLTSLPEDNENIYGFYTSHLKYKNLVKCINLDRVNVFTKNINHKNSLAYLFEKRLKELKVIIFTVNSKFYKTLNKLFGVTEKIKKLIKSLIVLKLFLSQILNIIPRFKSDNPSIIQKFFYCITPHYYLFPEVVYLKKDIKNILYLPDYLPHFFKHRSFFNYNDNELKISKKIIDGSFKVLTNSDFSKNYLPNTDFNVDQSKIISFPMVFLNSNSSEVDYYKLSKIINKNYIFYPTQPHPHKRLDLLIEAWIRLNNTLRSDLKEPISLVLTCGELDNDLLRKINKNKLINELFLFPSINDASIRFLYEHALCLSFTSELEGNFPTQLIEAFIYNCPIVCFDFPLLDESLTEIDKQNLLISEFGDVNLYVMNLFKIINHRQDVIDNQNKIRNKIIDKHSYLNFKKNIYKMHNKLII